MFKNLHTKIKDRFDYIKNIRIERTGIYLIIVISSIILILAIVILSKQFPTQIKNTEPIAKGFTIVNGVRIPDNVLLTNNSEELIKTADLTKPFQISTKTFTITQITTGKYEVDYAPYLSRADITPFLENLFVRHGIISGKIIWNDEDRTPVEFNYNQANN